ncbi:PAS domain-containing sensor histidine kinase [Acidihalobacter ferrooxydans]|uniref:histidine kinase n=1 Tax=Acidihalobacter ferrooxydans TaxID=1765967 RepID=A0A1P8UJD5_9GAMM|nr:PAS domain-containing sensor histidine kinase [Acidihalobacter ferrooxydans]APZ43956.1 hypothetical protein BW247_13350 [Acidihalobacter ferrooxydans]
MFDRFKRERLTTPPWRALQIFNGYRVLVPLVFLASLIAGIQTRYLGHDYPRLYLFTLLGYLAVGLLGLIVTALQKPPFKAQAAILATSDVAFVILLMHASGGINSGLGVLLIPAVGAVGVLLAGSWALFAAAVASLLLIIDQALLFWLGVNDNHAYAIAGFTGLALFATALISTYLANRARDSEALATRRGLDLANLTELSEYIVEHLRSGVIVADTHGAIRLINQQAWDLLGQPVGSAQQTLATLAPTLARQLDAWQRAPHARQPPVSIAGRDIQLRFTALGTDREAVMVALEDQAEIAGQIQAAKLASLGRLSASIAHEIRNPLSGIAHAAQLLAESAHLNESDQRLLEIVHTQSRRIDRIIDDVLRLSRKDPPATRTLDLTTWLPPRAQEIGAQLRLAPDELRLNLADTDLHVEFDAGHLTQIVDGLCTNAHRYGRSPDGALALTLAAHRAPHSRRVMLDVLDAGPGIEAAVLPHLFEPFFTTAPSGSGLGLYIASELAALNHARLEYLPVPGGGSCFRLQLPASPHPPPAAP